MFALEDRPTDESPASPEPPAEMPRLSLKPQEIPFDHPDSRYRFEPSPTRPFLATPAALNEFGQAVILECLLHLQELARQNEGLDYLVFTVAGHEEKLWFVNDDEGGAITAMLPSDYQRCATGRWTV